METDLRECYRILEVESGASLEEVKRSYRELVKVWHPDRFAHEPKLQQKAQEKLKQLNLAYEIICAAGPTPQASDPSNSRESETTTYDEAPAQPPFATKQRNNKIFMVAIAVSIVMGLIAVKFYRDGKNAEFERLRISAEQEQQTRHEEQLAEIKRYEMQAKAEAEAALLRKRNEADRLVAMEHARELAEEQTRQQLQQFDVERKTKFPGILIVTTQPTGATVTIDDDHPRKTPLSLNTIMPGKHRATIVLPGYETLELTAEVIGGETTDFGLIKLQRALGAIDIMSMPSNVQFTLRLANAALDTAPIRTGHTPIRIDDLAPGDYVVVYQRLGWPERSVFVQISKDKTATSNSEYKN